MKVEVRSSINSGQFDIGRELNIPEDIPENEAKRLLQLGVLVPLSKERTKEIQDQKNMENSAKEKDTEIGNLKDEIEKLKKMVVDPVTKKATAIKKPTPSTYRKNKTK